ncbi:unnamed protein product, partial [Bubo scandiacus]
MHPDSKHIVHDLRLQARGGLCVVVGLWEPSAALRGTAASTPTHPHRAGVCVC